MQAFVASQVDEAGRPYTAADIRRLYEEAVESGGDINPYLEYEYRRLIEWEASRHAEAPAVDRTIAAGCDVKNHNLDPAYVERLKVATGTARDEVMPAGAWAFDAEVAGCFPDMLRRSIPGYEQMRELVFKVGRKFVTRGTDVVDLGCSRGDGIQEFWKHFGCLNRFVLIDESRPMLEAARDRWKTAIANGLVHVHQRSLDAGLPLFKASLVLSVLTLQFVPLCRRALVLRSSFRQLDPGGAMIVVEKVLGATPEADALLVDLHHDEKRAAGYSARAIACKREALRKELAPLTAAWNVDQLRAAGFAEVECFWRHLNFAAWVAVKR